MDHYYPFCKKSSNLKPDLCLVTNRLLGSLDEEEGEKVQWPDTPGTAEVKILSRCGFTKRGTKKYDVKVEKVKEYRVLPDREIDRSYTTCASEEFIAPSPKEALFHPKDCQYREVRTLGDTNTPGDIKSITTQGSSKTTNESATERVLRNGTKREAPSPPETNIDGHRPSKRAHYEEKLRPTEQVSLYALEMLCRGVYSLHALNLIIVDDLVWVWWCDRQNVIQTTGLNFVQDLPYFMVLLTLFQRFTLTQWGVETSLVSNKSKFIIKEDPSKPVDIKLDAPDGKEIVASIYHPAINNLHYRGPVMKGRATCLLNATSPSQPGKVLAMKFAWPEMRRAREYMLINTAIDALKGSDVSKHLPKLLGWRDLPSSSTEKIIEEMKKICDTGTFPEQNPRNLRMLLFGRLDPVDKIKDEDTFMKAWLDCFKCHYTLWCKGIQHGDISVWNLMWDRVDGCGILNDFDLAVVKGSDQYRGGEQTGTLPFMSRRILENSQSGLGEKMYSDELESFTWVLFWLSLREAGSNPEAKDWKEQSILPIDAEWRHVNTFKDARSAKGVFVRNCQLESYDAYPNFPHAWHKGKCLLALIQVVESINTDWRAYGKTGEPYLDDIYLQVIKIIEDDEYDLDDVKDFKDMLSQKLRIVYVEYTNARRAAKAVKKSGKASVQ